MGSFASLRYLHDAECDSLVKFICKLSFKALNPSTFERQNVELTLQVFNNLTAKALAIREKTIIPYYENTNYLIANCQCQDTFEEQKITKRLQKTNYKRKL